MTAVLCALGVLVVTAALIFVLRPRDESGPPVDVPITDSTPPPSLPLDTVPAVPPPPS